jgi:8-oxo-dGTP diphosphatase
MDNAKRLAVVAAALIRQNGMLLIARRGPGGNCANLWEFPGGKQEVGETLEACLVRECEEELEVQLQIGREVWQSVYDYPDVTVELHFFDAVLRSGTPRPIVHQELRWENPEKLMHYSFCPGDEELLRLLCNGKLIAHDCF